MKSYAEAKRWREERLLMLAAELRRYALLRRLNMSATHVVGWLDDDARRLIAASERCSRRCLSRSIFIKTPHTPPQYSQHTSLAPEYGHVGLFVAATSHDITATPSI